MNRLIVSVLAVGGVLASSLPAMAEASIANISNMTGDVLVNQGYGFKPAHKGMTLSVGDRILVTKAGRATLKYASGCSLALGSGLMTTVSTRAPCIGGNTASARLTADNSNDNGGYSSFKWWYAAPIPIGLGIAAAAGAFSSNSP